MLNAVSKYCKKCGTSCLLAQDRAANGSVQIFWWCVNCWNYADPLHAFIRHDEVVSVLKVDITSIGVIERYPQQARPICEVCGQPGAEEHHWAPKHIFRADAERWPKSYLCKQHHDEWHARVTPNMHKHLNGKGEKHGEPVK